MLRYIYVYTDREKPVQHSTVQVPTFCDTKVKVQGHRVSDKEKERPG